MARHPNAVVVVVRSRCGDDRVAECRVVMRFHQPARFVEHVSDRSAGTEPQRDQRRDNTQFFHGLIPSKIHWCGIEESEFDPGNA